MHPIRLLILAALFYILFRMLFSKKKISQTKAKEQEIDNDILVEDPCCHTYIPQGQAIKQKIGGTTHYFCSKKCQQEYTNTSEDNNN